MLAVGARRPPEVDADVKGSRETEKDVGCTEARAAAAAVLVAVGRGTKLDEALGRYARRLGRRDGAFVDELAKQVVRNRRYVDYQLERVAAKPLAKLPPPVLDTLRMAVVELYFLRTPAYAAAAEAVAAVKASRFAGLAPFVNGVVRALAARDGPAEVEGDAARRLAVKYSYPDWFVRRWLERLGPAEAEEFLAANNVPAPLNVYPNPARVSRAALADELGAEGCRVTDGPFGSLAVALGDKSLRELRAFRDGLFVVVDPASSLGPRWLAPPEGATVADLCAGAGGKAVQLAWAVGPRGRVVAVDDDERRLSACAAAAERLGLANVETRRADVLQDEWPRADFVFLDAPCTNLGVIRRKPDVKWRVREEDVEAAAATQEAMLARALDASAPGAVVAYCVCSLEPEEGERVVERVLGRASSSAVPCRGEEFGDACDGPYVRTWPHRHGCNGGFAALLRKGK
ncbi:MAG TPA: transcription antitermination factor NusB [bacterium]|nr:transcription antitermination factor NusB [bacterium]